MKKNFILFLAITFAGLLTVGCSINNNAPTDSQQNNIDSFNLSAVKEIIKEKNNRFTQAHITGDTAFLNNIFATDAKAFPPNSDVITGRTAIAAVNSEWVKYGIKEFNEESTSFFGNKDYLIDEGTYYLRYGKDNAIDKGKYINVWKKEDGDWKLFSNMWNTSMPATPAK